MAWRWNYKIVVDGVHTTVETTKEPVDKYTVFSSFHDARDEALRILDYLRKTADRQFAAVSTLRASDLVSAQRKSKRFAQGIAFDTGV